MAAHVRPGDPNQPDLLAGAVRAVAASRDLEEGLAGVLEGLVTALEAGAGVVFLVDPDRVELHLVSAVGLSDDDLAALAVTPLDSQEPVARAARDARTVDWHDAADSDGGTAGLAARTGLAAVRYLPLQLGRDGIEATVGVLAVCWSVPPESSDADATALAAVADLLAVAIDRGRLAASIAERAEWLERLAHTDPLTGLANRRTLDRVLELELARAARQAGEVSVAIFDVDGLGEVNRESGHTAGDDILRAVASVLADSVRLVDTVARFGGDEFIVVAPGTGGATVAQRVIDGIAGHPNVGGRPVRVSAGIARSPANGTSAMEILDAAEAALAVARGTGTAQVATASGVVEPA